MGMLRHNFIKATIMSAAAIGLTNCSAPIATRIASEGVATAEQAPSFSLMDAPGERSALGQAARTMVIENLRARGWRQKTGDAEYSLSISLSERPAQIGIIAVETPGDRSTVISPPKERKLLQSCDDVEQRLSVAIVRISDGARIFRGDAAEYHCKAQLSQTMPFLVDAALSGLDSPGGQSVRTRNGRE